GASQGAQVATSDVYVIPMGVKRVAISFTLEESGNSVPLNLDRDHSFPVFGGFMPSKLALFDNDNQGGPRTRIVEGGKVTPGATVTLSYVDWRADREVDKNSFDLTIGEGQAFNRFGPNIFDVKGTLQYEVSFVYSVDGGQTWQDGGALDEHKNPDVLS